MSRQGDFSDPQIRLTDQGVELPGERGEQPPKKGREAGRVLVVDDDLFVGRAVSLMLKEHRQAMVVVASSGDEAWPKAQVWQPHLVLVDWRMPGMSAVELCQGLREKPQFDSTGIYILTGMLPEKQFLQAVTGLVQGVLSKPLDPRELLTIYDQWAGVRADKRWCDAAS